MLARNPLEKLRDGKVIMTVVDGKIVFKRPKTGHIRKGASLGAEVGTRVNRVRRTMEN